MFLEPGGEVARETRVSCEKMAEVSFAWELSAHRVIQDEVVSSAFVCMWCWYGPPSPTTEL